MQGTIARRFFQGMLFPMARPALAPHDRHDRAIVISPWMADLVRQYRAANPAPTRPPGLTMAVLVVVGAAIGGALLPTLLRRDRAAYPAELAKQQALELCSQADPTFVRFLASDRAACYAHFPRLVTRAAVEQERSALPLPALPR